MIKGEAQFACPKCKHPNFYFNIFKRVGFCHRAKCEYRPSLKDLIAIVGYAPDEHQSWDLQDPDPEPQSVEISLPEDAEEVVYYSDGQLMTRFPKAVAAITNRGVPPQDQYRFNINFDGNRVYIPVYLDGTMVSYVGRQAWWFESHGLRYKYPSGRKVTDYLFNWDEAKNWSRLTLVENTFNAIWLREALNCSSNFGSALSQAQAGLICASEIKSVALLWDEGADKKAEIAVKLLADKMGIPAAYFRMTGQPDDHGLDYLTVAADATHKAAVEGKYHV